MIQNFFGNNIKKAILTTPFMTLRLACPGGLAMYLKV
jgi:hypothetical protein